MSRAGVLGLALVVCGGCVTSGDLSEVSATLSRLERTVQDDQATSEDVKRALEEAKETLAEVQERVAERTEKVIEDSGKLLDEGGLSALITALGMALLSTYRNHTRRRDLEKVVGRKAEGENRE